MSEPLCGILVIDKPEGLSSMQVVARVRRSAGGIRTGHAGTLDPLATGVLVVALGKATKQIDRLMATDKHYRTVIDLSAFTTTDDREGERTEVQVTTVPDEAQILAVLRNFVGTILQRPPAFSAMKVGGRRAYKLARRGETVELQPRPVTIHSIQLCEFQWPQLEIQVHCGKGTYIRSLARDVGSALGCGGHCASLRRTAVGPFDDTLALRLENLPPLLQPLDLISLDQALAMLDRSP